MGQYYFEFLHAHALFWLIAIILFALAVIFIKNGKGKAGKIFQMTLRLFFVLLIVTGGVLVYINGFHWSVLIKGALAIWLISVMEILVTKTVKSSTGGRGILWLQFIVSFILVLYFGYVVT